MSGWPSSIDEHPEAAARLQRVADVAAAGLPQADRLDPTAVTAVRDRVAALVTGAPLPPAPSGGGPLEAAVAAYGEQLALDPHGVVDRHVHDLLDGGCTPAEVVSLTVALGMADGAARLAALLRAAAPTSAEEQP